MNSLIINEKGIWYFWRHMLSYDIINPIQDGRGKGGGGQKDPPTSFSPVTYTNVGIRPQNFLTFSFNPFDRLV